MRTLLTLLLATTLTACTATSPTAAPTPTPAAVTVSPTATPVVPDQLRPITGSQICAALPKALQASLLPPDPYGNDVDWSHDVASTTKAGGRCEWHFGADRTLRVIVEASGTVTQTATDHAKQEFEEGEADAAELAVKPDSDDWTYTPPAGANHGDAAFSVTGTGRGLGSHRARYVHMLIRQGPWLISIRYRAEEFDRKLPAEAELLSGANQIAEVFTAEMAKEPSAAASIDGPCGAISTAEINAVFFPSVTEVHSRIAVDNTTCFWQIRDEAGQTGGPCGRGVIQLGNIPARCGELSINVHNIRDRGVRNLRAWFDDRAKIYARDARRLKESFVYPKGLGDRAFAVVDQVHVLAGDHLVVLNYDGTNIGGGPPDTPGYQKPDLDQAALRKSLIRIATLFASGLST